jgi:hypothetical protein
LSSEQLSDSNVLSAPLGVVGGSAADKEERSGNPAETAESLLSEEKETKKEKKPNQENPGTTSSEMSEQRQVPLENEDLK